MMDRARELPIPPAALLADGAFELVRVWIANGAPHVSMATQIWKDPAAWGIFLVDLARHVARAYEQTEGRDQDEVLERIRAGFMAEFAKPTSKATGGILSKTEQ